MPRIRRWFHCSHDINSDPEVWIMRRQIGEKALSIWLEFLSIEDRNEGFLISQETAHSEVTLASQSLVRSVAGKCQANVSTVSAVWQFAESRMWIVCDPIPRVRNHVKYHPSRDAKEIPQGSQTKFPPSLPSLPNLPKEHYIVLKNGNEPSQSEPATENEPLKKKARGEYSEGFRRFRELHPHGNESPTVPWGIWKRKKLEPLTEEICQTLERQKKQPALASEGFKFFSHMPRYLREERWRDEQPREQAEVCDCGCGQEPWSPEWNKLHEGGKKARAAPQNYYPTDKDDPLSKDPE